MNPTRRIVPTSLALLALAAFATAEEAELILQHGKVVTVDRAFAIRQALSIKDGRILRVGSDEDVLGDRGPKTTIIDLGGRTVLPGLIDSHTHPTDASMIEFDHPIPTMKSIRDVLDYVRSRAEALGEGRWIVVRQVFITRLQERRYPTRAELDEAAPNNPVAFETGPDASLNSLALKLSGIDADFRVDGPGKVERDPTTGAPTGILRNCTRYIKATPSERKPTEADRDRRLLELLHDYNANGLTAIIDRMAEPDAIARYRRLLEAGSLPIRLGISQHIQTLGDLDKVRGAIRRVADDPLHHGGPMLRIVGIKTFLDGGMLTGSAYMNQPWGVSSIYSIDDPSYRGVLFIPHDRLVPIVRETVQAGLQFTAHSVGDGAVDALLDAYEEVNRDTPIAATRPCLTHANFMTPSAIARAAKLGVLVDVQPAWLYLDAPTLNAQFGLDRLRNFQPLRDLFAAGVVVGGGSDHMQKIGARRAINPYDPFLGIWIAITRHAENSDLVLHPEHSLSRADAIRLYTINNARLLFLEDQIGSLEMGKRADFVILDHDILTCPESEIPTIRPLATYLDGRRVFAGPGAP